jgi:predicted kinase
MSADFPGVNGSPPPLELIVFVGLQAAGKSTYFRTHLAATHVHVSKDLMKNTRNRDAQQQQAIEAALAAGRSVVVDNTNPTPWERAPLVETGRRHGARVAAYFFETTVKDALARNRAREGKARVPDVALFTTAKKLKPPMLEEGFDEVRAIAPIVTTATT